MHGGSPYCEPGAEAMTAAHFAVWAEAGMGGGGGGGVAAETLRG